MLPLVAPIFAQLITLGVADRSEVRYLRQEADKLTPAVQRWEASTNPDVRLSFRTRRSTLTLAYVPSLLITPLDHPPRQRLLFHNIRLLESYTWQRTTLSFSSNVGFGKVNLRAAGLQAPVTGLVPTDTTTTPAQPNQTPQDPNAPGTPATPTTPGTATPGTTTQPGQAGLVDKIVQHIAWTSTLSLAQNLTRRWTLGSFVGYSIDGGLDAASTKAYPFTRGSSVGASSTYTYLLSARHSFITSLNAQQLWSSNDNNVAALLGTENWVHVITPRTRNTAGAGLSVTRFSEANGRVGVSIFPTFNATISHEASVARGFLDLSAGAYAAPALDPVRATVDPRLGTSAVVRWSNKRFAATASGNAAISLARTADNANAIDSVNGSLILTYSIVDGFLVDGGVRGIARSFAGQSSIPPSWAGFVGVTFAYERLLNGSH